jgi:hypothetical protein
MSLRNPGLNAPVTPALDPATAARMVAFMGVLISDCNRAIERERAMLKGSVKEVGTSRVHYWQHARSALRWAQHRAHTAGVSNGAR